ncbi:MAG: hypothetical protein QOC96_218 [Acidobacteriota bacterium]|jgi:hypothetical protein|nr:hypothetical protein [Acidobacteriota bacterium]
MMKTRLHSRLSAIALILLIACQGWAQQQIASISQLRDQISQMERIDRDPTTPSDVKTLNHDFLKSRRTQLHTLVVKRIEALRKYQQSIGSSLTPEEGRVIEKSIKDLEGVLQNLDQEIAESQSSNIPENASLTTSQSVQTVRTTYGVDASSASDSTGVNSSQTATASTLFPPTTDIMPASVEPAPPPSCYPNVPERLEQMALATATLIINRRAAAAAAGANFSLAGTFERHYDEMVYLTVADALFTDKEKVNLHKLRWQKFAAETARTDKQIGASARSEGSTSAAEKPSFSDLLGFAVEHGAIQKEVNGTTLTLSSSPYALIAAGNGDTWDTSETYQKYDFFNRIGMSATFNISNQDNVLTNASRKQLSEWSVKLRLNRDRSARSKDFQTNWDKNVKPLIERRAIILAAGFNEAFNRVAELKTLHRSVRDRFEPITGGANGFLLDYLNANSTRSAADQITGLQQEILCRLKSEVYDPIQSGAITVDSDFRAYINQSITELVSAQLSAEEGKQAVEDEIKRLGEKPTSSFGYTNIRATTGSDYSVLKLLYEQKAVSPMNILANAALSFYHKPDRTMNQERVRDVVFALSFDGTAARSPFVSTELDQSQITFSFTGRYQRMMENRHVANKKADIASAQFKLEIPVFTGFSLPLSITYSNATEEGKKDHTRFNFGFTFDLDKLAALTKAKRE